MQLKVFKVSKHASWSGCFYVRIIQTDLAAVVAPEDLVGSQDKIEFLALRRKKFVFVIAVDCCKTKDFVELMKMIIEVVRVVKKAESIGLALAMK